MEATHNHQQVTIVEWLLSAVIGCSIAVGVWWGLLSGGGLVGGDTFTYFLPQKIVMADAFEVGEIPLWHSLTGLGYPLLAESQAGVFYPPNQVLYRLFDVNTAYHWGIVGHYCLAFVFAWRFGRCQRLSNVASLLAALIFVYGWFPARISHEWSIIGGMWFPLTLWLTDRLLQQPSKRLLVVLALCMATHLLSGHFTLAFINQLTLVCYALLKIWQSRSARRLKWKQIGMPVMAIVLATGCAAIQLVPTYELKLQSQRHGEEKKFDPAFGHMPPAYVSQLFASWWYWHTPEILTSKQMSDTPGAVSADTNHVEAHLYWGLIPFALVIMSATATIRRRLAPEIYRTWLTLSLASIVYSTGWLIPITKHLPGFGFFNGPGRYTMIAALGGAIIAASVFDALNARSAKWKVCLLAAMVGAFTLWDMLASSRHVADAIVVEKSPLQNVETSWIRNTMLENNRWQNRLLAPGPNVGNFFGVSCVPQYLGLGPAIYYDDILLPATSPTYEGEVFPGPEELANLKLLGITHLLTTEPITTPSPAIHLLRKSPDSFLNTIWGRGNAACYLYKLNDPPNRVIGSQPDCLISYNITEVAANSFEFDVDLVSETDIILKELDYPGWQVSVDNVAAESSPNKAAPFMRSVSVAAGSHTVRWDFKPTSFSTGLAISIAFLLSAVCLALWPAKQQSDNHQKAIQ